MARELVALQAAVSSAVEVTLEHSPDETFWVEVVDKLIDEFQKLKERCSWLENPSVRIYDLLLGPPSSRARLTNRLDEAG
jgi:hypothetical protein